MTVSHTVSGGDYGGVVVPDVGVTVAVRAVTVEPTTLSVAIGGSNTYEVSLATQPTGNVTVTPSSSATTTATVSDELTFTTESWATAQTITVTGVAAGSVTMSHAVAGGDYGANSVTAPDVAVTVAVRAVTVEPTTLNVTEGATEEYTVVLATQPTENVTITPSSSATTTATVSGALTFTTADWATAQTVTVTGVAAGDVTISHTVSGGDYGANSVPAPDVAVTVTAQGVTVEPTTLSVAEGASNTYTVVLATRPTADVTVTPSSSATAAATVSGALTFSADDWATAQTITVSGVAAGDATISHTVSGGDYGGVAAPQVGVTVAVRAVTVEPTTLSVAVGGSNTYEVSLATQPTADVTVAPSSSATATATVSGALTFSADDWATAQTVTVTGVAAGPVTMSHAVAGGDYGANSVEAPDVAVTVAVRAVTVEPTTLNVTVGATNTYEVTLATQPTENVTITPSSSATITATVSGALTFTTADWGTAQTVTVSGVAAGDVTISHAVAGGDYGANTVPAPDVGVTVTAQGVTVEPTTLSVAEGASNTYEVSLATQPTANVTVTPGSSDTAVATVSGALTFSADDWATAQTITVSGVAAGPVTISHAVAGGDYGGVVAPDVAVTVAARAVTVEPMVLSVAVGGSNTYEVSLATQPTADVTVTPGSSDTAVATVSDTLTFTTGTWATAQTVTVTGVAAGPATMSQTVAGGDYGTNSVEAPDVAVAVAVRAVTVEPTTLNVTVGATNTYEVTLATQPTADVTITPSSSATTTATVSDALTFTTDDWATAQTVTVSGVAAGDVTISHTVSGGDYGSVMAPDVGVTVTAQGVVGAPTTLSVAEGASNTYEVSLATRPTADVTVTPGSSDTAVATVSAALTFSADDWATAQTVTVSGVAAGDVTISHTVAGGDYGGVVAPDVTVTVAVRAVTVEPMVLSVAVGGSNTYEVSLATQPTADVTVVPSSSAAAMATVSGPLTFTTDTWATAQTVTVTGVAAGSVAMSHAVAGGDYGANSVEAPDVAVTVAVRAVAVEPTTLNVTVGASNTYEVSLATQPTENVTVTPGSSDTAVATVSGALTFTTADWETAQTITVTGVAAGPVTISHTVAGGDYGSVMAPDVGVTVTAQGVVGAPAVLSVAVGASNTYEVSLATQPTANVTVTPGSSDTAVATVSDELTFSADDWATAQTVTVSGVAAGDVTISHTVAGGDYGSVMAPDVAVTVAVRAVTVEPMVLSVAVGGSNTYEMSLATQPTADVTVTPGSSDTAVATVSDTLTFSADDWATAQTITVSGVAAGPATMSQTVAGGDYGANSVAAPDVAVTVAVRAVAVEPTTLNVTVGASNTYEVSLATQPTADVTVTPGSSDTAVATVSDELTFTTDTWATAQTITVSGVAAGDVTISHTVAGGDYGSVMAPDVGVTVTAQGVVGAPTTLSVAEGASNTYEVSLATQPTADVTVTPGSSDTAVATVSAALTFSADDWATAQTVTVSGVAAGDVTISHTVAGGDYGGVVAPDVGVTVAVRAVTVEPMVLSVAVGGSNTYEMSLATQPTADVTVVPSSSAAAMATVSGALTFTTDDWATAQTVTVTGVVAGDATMSHTVAGGDYGTNSVEAPDVAVTVAARAVTVEPTTLNVTVGASNTYEVTLATQPTADVTLTPGSSDTAVATVSDALTFSADDWATAQTITVSGVAAGPVTISHTVAGGDYGSVPAPDVGVTVTAQGVVGAPTTLSVAEGASNTYEVSLATRPTANVTITPSSSATTTATVSGPLTFTTGTWATAQTITVSGVAAGDVTISHTVAGGDYGGVMAPDVAVTVAVRAVTVEPTTLSVAVGGSNTYEVSLATQPTENVTVTPGSSDTAAATVSGILTFTADDWATAQTVTVTGVAAGSVTMSHAVAGGDYGANSVAAPDVAVTVAVRAVTVEPTTLNVTVGATNTYEVTLATQPTANVTITPSSSATTTATVSAALTFSADDWATAQTVTVSGAAAGDVTISHTVAGGDYGSVMAPDVAVTVTAQGVVGAPTTLSVAEGASNTYEVSLATQPTANVTVTAGSSDTAVATVSAALTFSADDWATAQTITVSGVAAGDATISHTVSGGDYGGVAAPQVGVTVAVRAVTVKPTTLSVAVDGSNTYEVSLATQPTADVTVAPSSSATTTATVSGALTFTTESWATAQTVTVSGVAAGSVTMSQTVAGGDYGTNSVEAPDVAVTVAARAVAVEPTTLNVTEGASNTYTVVLATQPTENVTVTPGSSDTAVATVSGELTFTTDDWATARTVTVSGVAAGDVTISHTVSGGDYGSVMAPDVGVTVTAQGVTVEPTTLSVAEGASNTYTVVLATQPTADVTVTAGSSDTAVATVSAALTFSADDWATAQTITVSGVAAGDATISHTVSGGDYGGVAAPQVGVTVAVRAVTVKPTTLSVAVDGSNTYEVSLATQPTADVTVAPSSSATTTATVSGALTFSADDWATAQTVTVSGVAAGSVTMSHSVSGGDYGTNSVEAPDVAVTVAARAVTVEPTTLNISEGTTEEYTVVLATQPTENVTVAVTGHESSDVTVSGAPLTFTTDTWETAQTVTVTAGADADAAHDEVTLTHTATGGDYDTTTATVAVTVTDDDAGLVIAAASTPLSVLEGAEATYTVALAALPAGEVSVAVTAEAGSDVTLGGVPLTFTTADWATAQTVTVTAGDDADVTDDEVTLTHTATGGDYDTTTEDLAVTVADDDAKLVIVATLSVPEGMSETYTVHLGAQPTGEVTVSVSVPSGTDVSVSGAPLTFTTDTWATAQTVTVTADADADAVHDEVTLAHSAVGGGYDDSTKDLEVTVADDDAGLTFDPPSASLSIPEGDTLTYTVVLDALPAGDVTVAVTVEATSDVTVSGVPLTFTTGDWSTAQTVTVTAGTDADAAHDEVTLTNTATGGDYDTVTATVAVTVEDDDAGLVLDPAESLSVTEGATATYTVRLGAQPAGNVSVAVTAEAGSNVTLGGVPLTFTTGDWSTAQTVTVTGGDDTDAANDDVTLTNSATGGDYDGTTADLAVTIEDDDAALVIDPSPLSVTEGATATYTVALAALPAGNVSVAVTGHAGTDVTVSGVPLTFTTDTWETAQTVTVTGGDDADAANDEVTLTHTATGGDYNGTTADLAVTVVDDDAALVIDPSRLSVPEGTSETYTVKLGAQPTGNVTVSVTGHAGTDVSVSGAPLTFTSGDWSTAQTVTVTGGDDADAANDEVTLAHSAQGGGYGAASRDLVVTVVDDDAALVVAPAASLTVTEGATATYTVALAALPAGNVSVAVTGHESSDLTVGGVPLTFTTGDGRRRRP